MRNTDPLCVPWILSSGGSHFPVSWKCSYLRDEEAWRGRRMLVGKSVHSKRDGALAVWGKKLMCRSSLLLLLLFLIKQATAEGFIMIVWRQREPDMVRKSAAEASFTCVSCSDFNTFWLRPEYNFKFLETLYFWSDSEIKTIPVLLTCFPALPQAQLPSCLPSHPGPRRGLYLEPSCFSAERLGINIF